MTAGVLRCSANGAPCSAPRLARRRRRALCVAIAAYAWLGQAASASAQEPAPPVEVYATDEAPPSGVGTSLLLGGAATVAGFYALGLGTSLLFPDAPNADALRIPVAGPFIALTDIGCGPQEAECETVFVVARTIVASLSALGQAGGLALMIEGLFVPRGPSLAALEGSQTSRSASSQSLASEPESSWYAAPFSSTTEFGLLFGGSF